MENEIDFGEEETGERAGIQINYGSDLTFQIYSVWFKQICRYPQMGTNVHNNLSNHCHWYPIYIYIY